MTIKKPFVRTPYNYDVDKASLDHATHFEGESLTQQHMRDDCDINNIVSRFGVGGPVVVPARMPTYGDFEGVSDYKSALDAIIAVDDVFMGLPPHIRERFQNDPAQLVDFCSDVSNRSEAMELGLIPPSAPLNGSIPTPSEDVVTPPQGG